MRFPCWLWNIKIFHCSVHICKIKMCQSNFAQFNLWHSSCNIELSPCESAFERWGHSSNINANTKLPGTFNQITNIQILVKFRYESNYLLGLRNAMACILHYPLCWHQCQVDAETAPRSLLSWLNKCMTGQSGEADKMNLLISTKLEGSGERSQWHQNNLKTKVIQNRNEKFLRKLILSVSNKCRCLFWLLKKLARKVFISRYFLVPPNDVSDANKISSHALDV